LGCGLFGRILPFHTHGLIGRILTAIRFPSTNRWSRDMVRSSKLSLSTRIKDWTNPPNYTLPSTRFWLGAWFVQASSPIPHVCLFGRILPFIRFPSTRFLAWDVDCSSKLSLSTRMFVWTNPPIHALSLHQVGLERGLFEQALPSHTYVCLDESSHSYASPPPGFGLGYGPFERALPFHTHKRLDESSQLYASPPPAGLECGPFEQALPFHTHVCLDESSHSCASPPPGFGLGCGLFERALPFHTYGLIGRARTKHTLPLHQGFGLGCGLFGRILPFHTHE